LVLVLPHLTAAFHNLATMFVHLPAARSFANGVKMAKAKKVVRRAWTKDDIRTMKTMAKARSGVDRIAKALKRTPGATSVMAAKLGVSLSMRA
jgi:hypothetical protein